ncbi:hypothetical protein VOI54_14350 [Tamlana sp. 2201CG12-4]|uniref:hypothetical protein n=1 Tax=Tamlana sp. 2201CG12-4 TaxID=3112582 RepID=UPI002DBBA2DF|nr:hypothetical protein [Tamlana sp. 2201CG12-4]MEC3908208.1 hypothetical protein [Tamlana sp. 2201CG12-4]
MSLGIKILVSGLFLLLSIPPLFFSWLLIRSEWNEHILYGDIEHAIVKKIEVSNKSGSSAGFGGDAIFDFKIISKGKFENSPYSATVDMPNPEIKIISDFISNVQKEDTIQVKILSKTQARVLKWKYLTINKSINYWGKLGKWIVIVTLFSIAVFLHYKTIKTIKIIQK